MAAVMIGVDPHKASHTAVAIGAAGEPLGQLRVRASAAQAEGLVAWAAPWPERTRAVEGAAGLGYLLARQLVAAGGHVLDVQPKLGARVRLLATGATSKNDPSDARSVAVAALRSPARRVVRAEDHAAVLKVWSRRHHDLGRARNQVACRLHAVLCELIPGGSPRRSPQARPLMPWSPSIRQGPLRPPAASSPPSSPATCAASMPRCATPGRDWQRRSRHRAPRSPASLRRRPGHRRHHDRLRRRRCPLPRPGPVRRLQRHRAHRGVVREPEDPPAVPAREPAPQLRHPHLAAVTQIRHRHSDGRAYYDKKPAEGKTPREALRCLKRQVSDAIYSRLRADARRAAAAAATAGPGGQPGTASVASAAGSHPENRLFGSATPEPDTTLRPPRRAAPARPNAARNKIRTGS